MPLTLPSFLPLLSDEPVRRIPIQSGPGANWTGPRWAIIPARGVDFVVIETGSFRASGSNDDDVGVGVLIISCFCGHAQFGTCRLIIWCRDAQADQLLINPLLTALCYFFM